MHIGNILRWIGLSFLTLLAFMPCYGEGGLKMDAAVRYGKLENGMTYFIRQNKYPEQRASFYIVRNVGSLVEADDQNGLAHFLEHLAFNGTRNFPGKGIVNMLENHGVVFGHNINAYTSYNETVYNLSDVPSVDKRLMDSCLLVLRDWADGLLLSEEEIDAERGVILEEARQGRNADFRLRQKTMAVLAQGSQYAKRNIIGSEEVVKNCAYERIRSLYRDWYRTDLQAVVIVGDVDVDWMEKQVKEVMGSIPAILNPSPRLFYEIPEHTDVRYVLATDPEASRTNIAVNILHRACPPEGKDEAYIREEIITNLYNGMLRARIAECGREEGCPFLSAGSGLYPFMRGYSIYTVSATSKPGQETQAFERVWRETERVKQLGFTRDEFERAKTNLLARLDQMKKNEDRISNEDYARSIQEYFLEKEPLLSNADYYSLASEIIRKSGVKDLAGLTAKWLTRKNMVITITAPTGDEKHLDQEGVLAIMDKVEREKAEVWTVQKTEKTLLKGTLSGGTVKNIKKIPEIGAVEWQLSNGAKVVFRKSYYERGQILLTARSNGGFSLYEREDLPSAYYLSEWMMASGIGEVDIAGFSRLMTGKQAGCDIVLNEYTEKLNGGSTVKDLECLLQLVYMRFERPRFDETAFRSGIERVKLSMAGQENNPERILQDSLSRIMKNYHPRVVMMNQQTLKEVDPVRMERIYRERFSNASDFTFFIVGDIEERVLQPLVEKYIGSITGTGKSEIWRDNGVRGPQGKLQREISIPQTNDKAVVVMKYEKEIKNTPQREICLSLLTTILENRLNERLREQEGGTYGVHITAGGTKIPYESFSIMVNFDCSPKNAVQMKEAVEMAVSEICQSGVTMDEVKKITRSMLLEEEQEKTQNGYWMDVIQAYYVDGLNIDAPENYRNIVKRVQPEEVKTFAQELLDKANIVDVTFKP
ncbi:MAG: insulinase family protein [Odoribacter sp.]